MFDESDTEDDDNMLPSPSWLKVLIPKLLTNVKADFYIEEAKLRFECDDRSMGEFRVFVLNSSKEQRCHLEGKNEDNADVTVVFDFNGYPKALLSEMFQMARCKREFERLEDNTFHRKFAEHRHRMLELLDAFKSQ